MKRLLLIVLMANISILLFAQKEFFYSSNGDKIYLNVRNDKIVIKTDKKVDQSTFLSVTDLVDNYKIATVYPQKTKMDVLKNTSGFQRTNISHIFEYEDGILQILSDQVFFKLKERKTIKKALAKPDYRIFLN